MSINLEKNKKLILFDGVCNLCDASVQYVIKHDKKDVFRYAALQSEVGQILMKKYGIDSHQMDSILLYSEDDGISYKSTAALKVASNLGFPLNLMTVFLILPSFLRDWVYDYIAKNRYKWYGKKEECMIPTADLKAKFLD